MNGIDLLGEAMSTMSDVNLDSQMTKSMETVTMIGGTSELSLDWSKLWNEDSTQYYIDSISAIGDQGKAATAAADYSKYQEDLQQGQTELGTQSSLLQSLKSVLKVLGNAMDQVYSMMQGPVQVMKAVSKEISILGG